MPKVYFFQLPELNKYSIGFGGKKAQNGSFGGLQAVSHFMPQRLQNVIKSKKGMPVTEILNTCT